MPLCALPLFIRTTPISEPFKTIKIAVVAEKFYTNGHVAVAYIYSNLFAGNAGADLWRDPHVQHVLNCRRRFLENKRFYA
jgi:hypothetical protein